MEKLNTVFNAIWKSPATLLINKLNILFLFQSKMLKKYIDDPKKWTNP